jgi:6-phosphogluconolactonase
VTAFEYKEEQGHLREIQTVKTLPHGYAGENSCADVHVHPSGRFLYGSNRGHDSIVSYAIDSRTGHLDLVGHRGTEGRKPRNFMMGPEGNFLLVANQDTDSIVTFRINRDSGELEPTGQILSIPAPVCLLPVMAPDEDCL